jgi:hypothetical protein
MSFDETNYDNSGEDPLPEESNNNRTFMIAVGILGGIILISVACLGAVYVFGRGRSTAAAQTQVANGSATSAAVNAVMNQALTATFEAAILPTTTMTPLPTSTSPVGVASPTNTPDPGFAGFDSTSIAKTATIGAAYTQAAAAQLTVVSTTTALPKTGFAEDVGLPGLVVMALAFVIVILLARRLRISPETNR